MGAKAQVGLPDQLAIEALFASAGLIASHKKDRHTPRVESESHSPFTIRHREAQFLHISVPGTFQSVNTRSAQLWSELLQRSGQRQNLPTDILSECPEFRLKFIGHFYGPSHD
jgi:hypothetical protein